ncbi:hypothetical protein IC617_05500 [Neiella sp. HB171785]|uniref:DUF3379 domain-containing protein n=1 Tax=Neiella litorisoli TaxID=2771431 RepID=A0A8J6UFK5_9GAMM|nr:hypothetical protein [Neiella litorisoli]MBD1388876.1 hypothetical protein [Neiella litorisoli]
MTNHEFEQQLQRQIDALPRQQQPKRDLWRGIEHALAESPQQTKAAASPLRWLATAASVCLIAVLGWFGSNHYIEQRAQQLALAQSQQFIAAMSDNHQLQKDSLLVALKGKPAFTDNWQQQLDELEDAANAIKEALEHDPRNPTLLKMLQSVYQQQLQLIERVHAPKLIHI